MADTGSQAVVRAYIEGVQSARGGNATSAWQAVGDLLHDEIVWKFAGSGTDQLWPVQLRGKAAVLERLSSPDVAWDRLRTQTQTIIGQDDVVLVEQVSTLIDESGVEVAKPVAHVFIVQQGLITAIRTYRNDSRPTH